jgi:hypothetical protein
MGQMQRQKRRFREAIRRVGEPLPSFRQAVRRSYFERMAAMAKVWAVAMQMQGIVRVARYAASGRPPADILNGKEVVISVRPLTAEEDAKRRTNAIELVDALNASLAQYGSTVTLVH